MRGGHVRRAAVLGAGVMGAQIAAHLANAGVPTLLFELASGGDESIANARKAVDRLRKLEPRPHATDSVLQRIEPANYDDHLQRLRGCDLVIEAIAERMELKHGLFERVAPHIGEHAILASNTSGLSVNALAQPLPESLRPRFCGVHFFNPPRYMHLVELVPTAFSSPKVLDRLETFLVMGLGKGVVRCRDTPNFIANRIGVFSILAIVHQARLFGLPFDVVDSLTGPVLGRPKSATFRTADVVGLDTLAHVIEGTSKVLGDDPWGKYYRVPDWMRTLIDRNALGQKAGIGIYQKEGREIRVFDPNAGDYRTAELGTSPVVSQALALPDAAERFAALRTSTAPQARFLWAIEREVFHYSAYLLETIAETARDVDLGIRWGFGWKLGPFESWQAAGWRLVAGWIREDIASGKTMSEAPLPSWVSEIDRVHTEKGSWSASAGAYKPRAKLAVYDRQVVPDRVEGEPHGSPGRVVHEDTSVRIWTPDDAVLVISVKSRMHTLGIDVLDGVHRALDIAEEEYSGLVIWSPTAPFSAGANLKEMMPTIEAGDFTAVENAVARFQDTTARLRQSWVPVVAAAQGLALGGGCEFLMHCDRVVAALETHVGLVESGVGLIPAGGGCKELALRASQSSADGNVFPFIKPVFETLAMARVAGSAPHAQELALLRGSDVVICNANELLHVALAQVRALAEAVYRPPVPTRIRVAGRTGIATLESHLANLREGGFVTPHDYVVARHIAEALCGGDVDAGSEVDEEWLLAVERRAFMDLIRLEKTQQRIRHTLETGKPLRN